MFSRLSLLFVFVTSAMAAVSSQEAQIPIKSTSLYRMAVENPRSGKSCADFKVLSNDKSFKLKELATLRYTQFCDKKPNWQSIQSSLKTKIFKKFYNQAQFEWLIKSKKFRDAYRFYQKNKIDLKIDDKDFDQFALKALKTGLTKKEKKQLRDELYKKSPRYIPNPKKTEYTKVAKDYRGDRKFDKALFYYRKVINDTKMTYNQRWYAFKGARITYKLERWSRMKKYIKATQQWADFLNTKYKWSKQLTKLHHNANIDYIRTLWTEKGQGLALKRLNKLEKQIKGRYSLQMVYWLKGRMAEERKEYKAAVRWLTLASKEKSITIRDRDRVLWALAWNQRRIQQFLSSQEALKKLKKSPELTFFAKTKYLYWQAANLESMGKRKEAMKAFDRLAQLDLYGYYGALSFRKLGKTFPKPPRPVVDLAKVYSFFNDQDRDLFLSLKQAGEFEITEALMKDRVKTSKKWGTDKWVSYLNLMQEAGAYKSFFYQYHTLPPKLQLSVLEEHPYLLFPQPYKQVVSKSAQQTKVSPALIYSIMKQESGFDVKARSHADAFGLLQLIPQVAKKAAKEMPSIPYSEPYDLYKPGVMIPLGATHLHGLFSKFKSNFILSVASYNANERAVKGWIKSRFTGDPVTFIEDIPYEETKGYVKLVMRNYITYNRFENLSEPFQFPEVCLQGLQSFKK